MGLCFNPACVPLDFVLTPKVVDPLCFVAARESQDRAKFGLTHPLPTVVTGTRVGRAASPADPLPAVADPRRLAAVSIVPMVLISVSRGSVQTVIIKQII
jgi:hypothetical protein